MKLLLVTGLPHFGHVSGASKGNRALMERLARRGHECRVVCPATGMASPATLAELRRLLADAGVEVAESSPLHEHFRLDRVDVYAVPDRSQSRIHLRASVRSHIRDFAPDRVLVASEDPGQVLLREALRWAPSHVVHLAQTTQFVPCGPASPAPDPIKTSRLQEVSGTISISRFLADYLRDWARVESTVFPYLAMDDGPFRDLGCFGRGAVTMVNPCTLKGLPILLALARRLPGVEFAAVPTWGARDEELRELAVLPNVQILPPSDDVEQILARTRILLVPSLWYEAFGAIALEASLRAIPVVASDVGGLREAKLGVGPLLPVRPIEYDEKTHEMIVPPQDLRPWVEALRGLLSDRAEYERVAGEARDVARAWVRTLRIETVEAALRQC